MHQWFSRLRQHARTDDSTEYLSAREAYARWAPTYAADIQNALTDLEQAAVLGMMPRVEGRAALDVGCGTGRYLQWLLRNGARRAIGLDLSFEMLAVARGVSSELVQADLLQFPLSSSRFDVIVCGLAVGYVQDLHRALCEIARVLVPQGIVIYSDLHPFSLLAGWKRKFRAQNGSQYAINYYSHLYAEHHGACRAAGLTIEEVREPRIEMDHEWRGYPAILAIRARKIA